MGIAGSDDEGICWHGRRRLAVERHSHDRFWLPLHDYARLRRFGLPNGSVRPDVVGTAELDNPTRKLWFNPQAYQRVTCQIASRQDLCHLGSAGYDQLRGPGQRNLDFSMFKNFPIKERYNLQLRWEAFNFTNTPWFGNPGGISFSNANQITPNGTRDGEIRSIQTPMRRMQFGLKFRF